jgi:hypothetical protein
MSVDDLFVEKSVLIDETLVKNPDERPDIFRYEYGTEFRAWHKENTEAGRPHIICIIMKFLHEEPDWNVLNEAFSSLTIYLKNKRGKFSNIAVSDHINILDGTWRVMFNIACDFRDDDISLFLDTIAAIYGILIYIHDKHNETDAVHFDKYRIAYIPYEENEDGNVNAINKVPDSMQFEELIYMLKCTVERYNREWVNEISNGLAYTNFFTHSSMYSDTNTYLWRAVISWVYKQQHKKRKIPLKYKVSDTAKEHIARAKALSVNRFDII